MKIHILDVVKPRSARASKDTNGGFGTVNEFGNSLIPRMLTLLKGRTMNFPELLPGYIISLLKKQGMTVSFATNKINPLAEIILIPTSIINFQSELEAASRIKNDFPDIIVGFVGGMASGNPELYENMGDFVIVGEIENLLLRTTLDGITGIFNAGLVSDLDHIPFPDWSYSTHRKIRYRLPGKTNNASFPIQGSRGCPMPCGFYCTYPLVQGSAFRVRSPENIIEEVIYLQKKYQMENVLFRDPIFSLKMERVEQFCQAVLSKNIKFEWICETHPRYLTPQLIRLMAKTGCQAIKLGIESANVVVMKKSHRIPDNIKHQEEIIQSCENNGIDVLGFFILGFFDDNEETIKETIRYACLLNTYGAQFTIATPYPGTPWYQSLKSADDSFQLSTDFEKYTQYKLVYNHPFISAKQLEILKNQAYKSYYFRWAYLNKHFIGRKFSSKDTWNSNR
jgi:anaerobic magnesium-protoporphyrin IX monomethyl ester cyclase